MTQKPKHVKQMSADVPHVLRLSSHICNGFYIQWLKCGVT